MLVVLASRHDSFAHHLVNCWQAVGARLLTCADLSVIGWQSTLAFPSATQVVVGREVIASADIQGVYVRLSYVMKWEIPHIRSGDRSYVAAEMNAFLTYWLAHLPCPVLNRPTATGLMGPNWRSQQWVYVAAQLGIPVYPLRQSSRELTIEVLQPEPPIANVTVTIVGNQSFGTTDALLIHYARRLAEASQVELLAVNFTMDISGIRFLGVDLCPDVSSPELADAILAYLCRRH